MKTLRLRLNRRTVALTVLLVAGAGLFGGSPATADPPPFYENYSPACGTTAAIYPPFTSEEIRVSVNPHTGSLDYSPYNLWVCLDTGTSAGAHSVGTAGYVRPGQVPGVLEHTPVCAGVSPLPAECTHVWTGYEVHNQDAGTTGTKPCAIVSKEAEREVRCISVGVTPNPSTPVQVSTWDPGSSECFVVDNGNCATDNVKVQVGGPVATAYVGTSPVPVDVPAACVTTHNNLGRPVTAGLPTC